MKSSVTLSKVAVKFGNSVFSVSITQSILKLKVIREKFDEFRKTRQESTTMEDMLMEDSEGRKGRRLAFLDMLLCAAEDGSKLSTANIQEEVDTFMFEVMFPFFTRFWHSL